MRKAVGHGIAAKEAASWRRKKRGSREMKKMAAILSLFGAVTLLMVGIQGCNTVKGMGQDIKRGGEIIEETAKDVMN